MTETAAFDRDARDACSRWNLDYPKAAVAAIREYLAPLGPASPAANPSSRRTGFIIGG